MEEQLVVLMDPCRDKYDRLLEAHEKLQKLNQILEEKLLKLAENNHVETQRLSYQIQELTQRLVEARLYIHQLEDENDRYRSDINVVVQLLHCKPSNFVSPKLDVLPEDLQRKVIGSRNGSNFKREKKIIKVHVPAFPPTDLVYSVDKGKGKKNSEKDIVSAAIMAKILEERENERKESRNNRCKCASKIVLPLVNSEAQTAPACTISLAEFNFSDYDDEADEDVVDEEDEDEDIIYERKSSSVKIGSKPQLRKPNPTVDDIMKTDQKEEELLPTPLFLRRNKKESLIKHESQDSNYSSGSSNCNTTTNNSNSNISHSSRMSSIGVFEEDQFVLERSLLSHSHPSPASNSQSVSSASPDIHISQSHFFEDFDPESILQGLNGSNPQYNFRCSNAVAVVGAGIHQTTTTPTTTSQSQHKTHFSYDGKTVRPQSLNFGGFGSNNGVSSGSLVGPWDKDTHWRSTVLVHQPPKAHSYEPLALTSMHQNTSTFSHRQTCIDSPSHEDDEENPLLQNEESEREDKVHNSSRSAQYYRTQKKSSFWNRNISVMSTETEI